MAASAGTQAGSAAVVPEWYQGPTFYFTNPYALVGAHDDVPVPPGSELLDFELEVAVVVGRDGASLTPEQAREHVFGYTVMNDWSARDLQCREMKVQLGPAKGKDSATTLGPWLATADELEPYRDPGGFLALDLRASVNGELTGQDLLSNMGWPFEELISYASRGTEVPEAWAGRRGRAHRARPPAVRQHVRRGLGQRRIPLPARDGLTNRAIHGPPGAPTRHRDETLTVPAARAGQASILPGSTPPSSSRAPASRPTA